MARDKPFTQYSKDTSETRGQYINVPVSSGSSSTFFGYTSQYSYSESASSATTWNRSSTTLSSTSTSATSTYPPEDPPDDTNVTMLQCTFHEVGCKLQFGTYDLWYSHCLSHWNGHPPPRDCLCIFCEKVFRGNSSWRKRMSHIARHHLSNGWIIGENSRPDFVVYRYMYANGLLPQWKYNELAAYSECESAPDLGLLPLNYPIKKVPSRSDVVIYDQVGEDRLRRRQGKASQKGKNRESQ